MSGRAKSIRKSRWISLPVALAGTFTGSWGFRQKAKNRWFTNTDTKEFGMKIQIDDSLLMESLNTITTLTNIAKNKPLTPEESAVAAEAIKFNAILLSELLKAGGSMVK